MLVLTRKYNKTMSCPLQLTPFHQLRIKPYPRQSFNRTTLSGEDFLARGMEESFLSLEEEEMMAQKDAALDLVRDLEEKIRTQTETYDTRTEAAEVGRLQAKLKMNHLLQEGEKSAQKLRIQASFITWGWLGGVIVGWVAALLTGGLFSPVLGFMLVRAFCARMFSL
ncbi:unnamed protein product [Choristocarpus tenellus]